MEGDHTLSLEEIFSQIKQELPEEEEVFYGDEEQTQTPATPSIASISAAGKSPSVAQAVERELGFFYQTLYNAVACNKYSYVADSCFKDERNTPTISQTPANVKRCRFCWLFDDDSPSSSDKLQDLIASAAIVGLVHATGTLVGTQLTTDCSRIQKRGESMAGLGFDSFVDIVYSSLNEESLTFMDRFLNANARDTQGEIKKAHTASSINDDDDNDREKEEEEEEEEEESNHIVPKEYRIDEEADKELEDLLCEAEAPPPVHEDSSDDSERGEGEKEKDYTGSDSLSAVFRSDSFINTLSRLNLSGGSFHALRTKYKSDEAFISPKDPISTISATQKHCDCKKVVSQWLTEHYKQ